MPGLLNGLRGGEGMAARGDIKPCPRHPFRAGLITKYVAPFTPVVWKVVTARRLPRPRTVQPAEMISTNP
jgi:hypothetical protein